MRAPTGVVRTARSIRTRKDYLNLNYIFRYMTEVPDGLSHVVILAEVRKVSPVTKKNDTIPWSHFSQQEIWIDIKTCNVSFIFVVPDYEAFRVKKMVLTVCTSGVVGEK